MDGILMSQLHGNLNLLSGKSFQKLLTYVETGTLSLQDQSLLLNEITEQKVISLDRLLQSLKN